MIWLAAGNINGLSVEKCKVLKNRNVFLYPDLGAFEKWSLKAEELQEQYNCKITVSKLLEDEATDTDRTNGLDIADYIITELTTKKTTPKIQNSFSPTLEKMIKTNKALSVLIKRFQLEEL
jgi:type I restriction enzyme R subunit